MVGLQRRRSLSERAAPFVFIGPALLLIIILSVTPIGYSLYISFLKYNISKPARTIRFYGLENYIKVLTDPMFLNSILWTLKFAVISVAIEITFGMAIAVGLNSEITRSYNTPMKTAFIMPMMIAAIVSATVWKLMFYPVYGVVNCTLNLWGYPAVNWLGETLPARIGLILVEIWGSTPFCILVFQAALKTINTEILEAARVDGASAGRCFFSITLPSIRNFVALIVTVRISDALRSFDAVFQLTNGGPGTSTETIATVIYKMAFRYSDVGAGSAGAFIFFVIVSSVALVAFRFLRKDEVME
ncbi:MAG: sugar ABC transporter permease [Eubacteriales bacterium]|nr:sugar ABC transporter permease [Eubacteriales bacterium]